MLRSPQTAALRRRQDEIVAVQNVAGLTLTQQTPLNIAGYRSQLTLAAPMARGARYAATTDVAVGRGFQLGIGAGIGKLRNDSPAGFIVSPFASLQIAPKSAVVARYYTGGNPTRVGSTTFVGLQYTI